METIVSQLILFEGYLRKEQTQISQTLQEKDKIILLQRDTILKLANKNEQLRNEYIKIKEILQNILNQRDNCGSECTCKCHQFCDELNNMQTRSETDGDSINESDVFEAFHRPHMDEDTRELHKEAIQECTISLNTSMSKPRRIVESGSIRELAKHHRQRRASGGTPFIENNKTPVTRSNSLPDAKLLHVMQVRAKNLTESSLTSSSGPVRLPNQETMPLLHSEAVLNHMARSTYHHDKSKVNNSRDNGQQHTIFIPNTASESQHEVNEAYNVFLEENADIGPPQFYDIDDDNVLNEEFRLRSGKFKHVKSPPNQSPNKNPRRPKEFKKRHKLKSHEDMENVR